MKLAAIDFAPLVPWPLLVALGLAGILVIALGFRARGAAWRAITLLLLLVTLAHPVVLREQRETLDDVLIAVVDRSPSQAIGDRLDQVDAALDALRETVDQRAGLVLRDLDVTSEGVGGTRLFAPLRQTLAEVDRDRLAGVVLFTDGQVHDVPTSIATLDIAAPVHVLLSGEHDESDRQLVVEQVPSYGMVGESQSLTLRVDEIPAAGATRPIGVTVRQDGAIIQQTSVMPGVAEAVTFSLRRAGKSVIEIDVAAREDELTTQNNRAVLFVNGVRDRLRVLLVSGQPYPGLRVWRNLLKADPAVDLVHFTILRPPEKQDGTPIRELALIAFPSRELFEVKLDEFDLVIFDRYSRRGLLPLAYLDNVARYVENGGALLEVAGPEFARALSLYRTPLARVLPGRPSGEVYERGFLPALTELGRRHPVTSGLDENRDPPTWGRWFRQIDVEVGDAQVVMSGVSDRPLLMLKRVGHGRVAQLLSDHAWLWARGYEGGGPQSLMLRRLVHWLMQEPELEEESLNALPVGNGLEIRRRSLEPQSFEVTVTAPSGATRTIALEDDGHGLASGVVEADEPGLYQVSDGSLSAYAAVNPISPTERADMRATDTLLAPLVEASNGALRWLADSGLPQIRSVRRGRSTSGRGWIGVHQNERYLVVGSSEFALLPPLLGLVLILGTLTLAWYREGR